MQVDATAVLERIRAAHLAQFADIVLDSPCVRSTSSGETPLHIVAVWGDAEAARTLLDAGADIDAAGEEDYTPLHEAICQGHRDLVELLVQRGASLTLRSRHGDAIALATVCGDTWIEDYIKQRGEAEPGAPGNRRQPPRQ